LSSLCINHAESAEYSYFTVFIDFSGLSWGQFSPGVDGPAKSGKEKCLIHETGGA